jgi:hypothetical protein
MTMNDKAAQVKQVTDAMIKKIADRVCSALDVNFQEVVHSDLAGNADVTKPQ